MSDIQSKGISVLMHQFSKTVDLEERVETLGITTCMRARLAFGPKCALTRDPDTAFLQECGEMSDLLVIQSEVPTLRNDLASPLFSRGHLRSSMLPPVLSHFDLEICDEVVPPGNRIEEP
jgi:hypothetical protein